MLLDSAWFTVPKQEDLPLMYNLADKSAALAAAKAMLMKSGEKVGYQQQASWMGVQRTGAENVIVDIRAEGAVFVQGLVDCEE